MIWQRQNRSGALPAYYNEIDPYAAQWLRNLIAAGHIAPGDVDDRDIREVKADDLKRYEQCHFFAGIGGWSYALRLAGWPDDRHVWTGSCPCQKLSGAARGRTVAEDLWPAWLPLIAANRPGEIFGEQVAHKGTWLDQLCDDLGSLGYEIGAAVLTAVGVGKDHSRSRIYFVGHTNGNRKSELPINGKVAGMRWHRNDAGDLVQTDGIPARMVMRGFGNAIVPQVAAQFIGAFLEIDSQ